MRPSRVLGFGYLDFHLDVYGARDGNRFGVGRVGGVSRS